MELKSAITGCVISVNVLLLIVPYGIEIVELAVTVGIFSLLIVPYGIEIKNAGTQVTSDILF